MGHDVSMADDMGDEMVGSFREVVRRWDLRTIQHDVRCALGRQRESERPYVARNLARALDMFIDSNG